MPHPDRQPSTNTGLRHQHVNSLCVPHPHSKGLRVFVALCLFLLLWAVYHYSASASSASALGLRTHESGDGGGEEVVRDVRVPTPVTTKAQAQPLTRSMYSPGHTTTNQQICHSKGDDLQVFIAVTSAPDHFEARRAIRFTWGHAQLRRDVALAFLVGATANETTTDSETDTETRLAGESALYGDLIRGRFLDTYDHLSLKTLSMLEWVDRHCPGASFVLKTDDDVFIDLEKLLKVTRKNAKATRTILGAVAHRWGPVRGESSKYFVSREQFGPDVFPDFVSGPAYLVGRDAVHDLFAAALELPYLKLEDVFVTGIAAEAANVTRVGLSPGPFWRFMEHDKIADVHDDDDDCVGLHGAQFAEQFKLWERKAGVDVGIGLSVCEERVLLASCLSGLVCSLLTLLFCARCSYFISSYVCCRPLRPINQ